MFSDIYSDPTAKREGGRERGGGGGDAETSPPPSVFFFFLFSGCNLTRPFCGLWLRSLDLFVIECLQTFLIFTLIKEIESKPIGVVSLVLTVCRLELAL